MGDRAEPDVARVDGRGCIVRHRRRRRTQRLAELGEAERLIFVRKAPALEQDRRRPCLAAIERPTGRVGERDPSAKSGERASELGPTLGASLAARRQATGSE